MRLKYQNPTEHVHVVVTLYSFTVGTLISNIDRVICHPDWDFS